MNMLSRSSIILTILLVAFNCKIFGQGIYGPKETDLRRDLFSIDYGNAQSNGLLNLQTNILIGHKKYVGDPDLDDRYRGLYQWNFNNDIIPDGSTITLVQLTFNYNRIDPYNQTPALYAYFYNINSDLTNPDIQQIFNYMQTGSNRIFSAEETNYNSFDLTFTNPSDPLVLAIQNSLIADKFILGIREGVYYFNHLYSIVTSSVKLRIEFIPPNNMVTINQKLSVGNQVGVLKIWEGSNFSLPFNPGSQLPLQVFSNPVLLGDQTMISSQKYNNWNNDFSEVKNHRSLTISPTTEELTSNFSSTFPGITLKNILESSSVDGGNINFKDPWLIDYPDPQFGNTPRNRGMDAPFKQRTSPFYPNYSTSYGGDVYKGVFLNQGYPNWQPPYYSIKSDYEQNISLSQTGRTHKFYFQNWTANPTNGASFQSANNSETPVVFLQDNTTVQANLKGTQLSNNIGAYTKGSQRKFMRITYNNNLYSVYESMGNIYVERSTDGGSSWHIFNNTVGQRLNTYPAHSPSMDFYNVNSISGDVVLVTFVEDIDATTSRIMVVGLADKLPSPLLFTQEVSLVDRSVTIYGDPVIACAGGGKFIIAFKGWDTSNDGIYYRRGTISNWQLSWVEQNPYNLPKVSNTDAGSYYPTIAEDRNTTGVSYQLAWQQGGQYIKYCKLTEDAQGQITVQNYATISSLSTYIGNTFPSIVALGTGARVCWKGQTDDETPQTAIVFRDPAGSRFWSFGNNVSNPNINKSNDNTYYALGWSQSGTTAKFADNNLSTIYEIFSIPGRDVQISNGNGKTNMFANVFKATGQPYFFTMTNNLNYYYNLQKGNGLIVSTGRTGVLGKNDGEIYFALGDILLNGQKIGFVECPQELDINNVTLLNEYLVTEPFAINDNSSFEYSVQYGVVDTANIEGFFTGNDYIRFKVELLDDNTGLVLGAYDDVIYNLNNLVPFNNINYQVNTNGVGQRMVRLRLVIEENISPMLSMVDKIDNQSVLGKSSNQVISYQGSMEIYSYELAQNYPNPFNPATIIRYQIPSDGLVTLRIYDILGREITTLVNEEKATGRYEVNFDASNLASGVYIYELRVNDFVNIKKMMLLK